MSTCTFQAQLVSIMEILAKAAVAEINRRVDDGCAVIRLEMSRSQRDIDILKRKCQLMENELRRTRGRGRKRVVLYGTPERLCLTPRNVCVRERSPSVWRGEHVVHTVEENLPPSPPSTHVNAHELEDVETAEIKLERAQDELWKNSKASENVPFCQEETMSPSPTLEDAEPDMPADDPMEPNTQPDNSSSELIEPCSEEAEGPSGMVFLIKTENEEDKEEEKPREEPEDYETKEEEREHLEFDLGERDMRLWSSLTEGNGDLEVDEAESAFSSAHLSHHLAIFPTAAERSGNKPTSAGKTQVELYGTAQASRDDQPQHSPWAGDSRPQPLGHTTQSLARARLRAVSDNANLQQRYRALLRPEDTALGALNTHGASSVAGPTFAGCGQGALGGARRLRTHWRAGADGEKRFSCSFCDRGFVRFSQLKEHLRSHTGEKPYSCAQCGRSFTKQCNLIRHAVVHSGEKPYQCSQCGKCFTQRSSLKSHQRTHLGEKERSLYGLQVNRAVRVPRLNPSQTRGFM